MTTQTIEHTITAFLDGEDSLDIPNIIHSTEGAERYGYTAPLVGGVTVYAWSVAALLEALGDAWLNRGWVEFQLRRPVFPNDQITTRVTPLSPRTAAADAPRDLPLSPRTAGGDVPQGQRGVPPTNVQFTMTKANGETAVRGTAGLGDADFHTGITQAADRTPRPALADPPFITRGVAPIGADLRPMAVELSAAEAEAYADQFARDPRPRWRGPNARVHPAWIALRPTKLLEHSWRYTAGIHAASQIQHLAPIHPDQPFLVSGRIPSGYQRKGHEYALLDVTLSTQHGPDLARIRQTTIYQAATSEQRKQATS